VANFGIAMTSEGSVARLGVQGDVDMETAPMVLDTVLRCGVDWDTVVVDLRQVDFLDSSGIGALLLGQQRLQSLGSKFELDAVPDKVRLVMEMAGVTDSFGLAARAPRVAG
jgi:anti-sigma B factor antagonist